MELIFSGFSNMILFRLANFIPAYHILLIIAVAGILAFSIFYFLYQYRIGKLKIERKLRESVLDERNQLRTLIDSMPDMIFIKNRESRFLMVNRMVARVMGTTPDALIGKTDFDFYASDLAQRYYEDEQAIMQEGQPKINYEEPHLDERGNRIILSTSKVPLKNSMGEVTGIVGIGRDITRLKRIEVQLRKKTEDLQEINRLLEERQEEIMLKSEELSLQADNLKTINIELERLNKTKDKFFSIIAHDLRNPFNGIMGFSDLLCRDFNTMTNRQKLQLIELINLSSESAFNLLENLLQWARTQTDKIKFMPEYFDITPVIKQVIDLHGLMIAKKGIKIQMEMHGETIVYADKNMIHTVIRNIISNAIKFTGAKGLVHVTAGESVNMIEITVTDSGVGMKPGDLDNLFRIDTYSSTSGTSGETGTGLGLIICKEFIEKNNGKIRASSEEGKGTTVSFTLMRHPENDQNCALKSD